MAKSLMSKLNLEDVMSSSIVGPITDVIENASQMEIEASNIGDDPELNEAEAIEENLVAKAKNLENITSDTDSSEMEKISALACATEALEYARNRLGITSISITHEDFDTKLKLTHEGLWKTIWEFLKRFITAIVVKVKHFLASCDDQDQKIEKELRSLKNIEINQDLNLHHALAFRLFNIFILKDNKAVYEIPNGDWHTTISNINYYGRDSILTDKLISTSRDICKTLSGFDISHLVKSYTMGHRDDIDEANIVKVKDNLYTIYELLTKFDINLYLNRSNKDMERDLYGLCGPWISSAQVVDSPTLRIHEEEFPSTVIDLLGEKIGRQRFLCKASVSLGAYNNANIENYMEHDGEVTTMSRSDATSYVKACLSSSESLLKSTKSVSKDINMLTKHLDDINKRLSKLDENSNNLLSETDGELYRICLALRYAINTYFNLMLPVVKFTRILINELLRRAQLLSSSMDVKA